MSRAMMTYGLLIVLAFFAASCGMMAGMMGMGDKWKAMNNMDAVMDEEGMSMELIMAKRSEEEQKAFARGRDLFMDASLGRSNQSCSSCHPGGGAADQAASVLETGQNREIHTLAGASARYPKYDPASNAVITLRMRNNNCLVLYMGGKRLALDSWDASSLAQYVTSFSNGMEISGSGGN